MFSLSLVGKNSSRHISETLTFYKIRLKRLKMKLINDSLTNLSFPQTDSMFLASLFAFVSC